jgi:hypothetical protein
MTRTSLFTLAGFVLGVLALAAFRLAFAHPEPPIHYHANFAVFAEGERIDLSDDRYMQDVALCAEDVRIVPPPARVHLHNNNQDVVHVHHGGATWGHLMANLRFVLGDRVMVTRDGDVYLEGGGRTLKFILNGRPQLSVYNETIRPGDRLLISFGPENEQEVLTAQFPVVASDAERYDGMRDPTGCGGPDEPSLWTRIRHVFTG